MKCSIKTADNKWWVGRNGEEITKNKKERFIYDTKYLAKWYSKNTNVFGELKIIEENKSCKN